MNTCRWILAAAAGPLFLLGCELAEVTTASGEDLLVVEAVLRAGDPRQRVLLHRSLAGEVVRGEPGARVAVRTPDGGEVRFAERPLEDCVGGLGSEELDSLEVRVEATCYATRLGELEVVPGERYRLSVETRTGETLRGETRVPGGFRLLRPDVPLVSASCSLPPGTSLRVVWSSAEGAWSYLVAVQIFGLRRALQPAGIAAPDVLELTGVAISESDTTVLVPAELGLFERFDSNQDLLRALQGGFPPGVSAELVVAAADRNFVNGVRGGGFNPSGNVRISSVVGDGVGVFGSLVPRRVFIVVGGSDSGPPGC